MVACSNRRLLKDGLSDTRHDLSNESVSISHCIVRKLHDCIYTRTGIVMDNYGFTNDIPPSTSKMAPLV